MYFNKGHLRCRYSKLPDGVQTINTTWTQTLKTPLQNYTPQPHPHLHHSINSPTQTVIVTEILYLHPKISFRNLTATMTLGQRGIGAISLKRLSERAWVPALPDLLATLPLSPGRQGWAGTLCCWVLGSCRCQPAHPPCQLPFGAVEALGQPWHPYGCSGFSNAE